MSNPTTSLVAVSAKDALLAVPLVLADVKRTRDDRREQTIQSICHHIRVRTGWFKSRPMTRAEAEAIVDGDNGDALYTQSGGSIFPTMWKKAQQGNETLAGRITSAAALTQDGLIWLNLEEADWLCGWMKQTKEETKA